jgi:phage-related protein
MDLVSAIGQGLLDNADSLLSSALDLVTKLVDFIIQGLPEVLSAAFQIIETIGNGLVEYAPKLITSVTDVIIKLVDMLTNPDSIKNMVKVALDLVTAIGNGLIEAIPRLIEKVPDIINGIVTAINDNISTIIGVGVKLMTSLLDNIPAIIEGLVTSLPEIIDGIIKGIGDNLPAIIEAGVTLFTSLISNTAEIIAIIAENIPTITTSIIDALMAVDWVETGKDIMKAIISGMEAAVTGVLDFPTMLRNKIGGFEPGDIGYKQSFGESWDSVKKAFETGEIPATTQYPTGNDIFSQARGTNVVVNQNNYFTGDSTIAGQNKARDDILAALAAQ